ncbi:MAG: ATP-binding cassette domain-containing protein [Candidatus Aminicenantes bacterium]|nr:ATP-binding cassette domain-containing protein [Candidatus Aminicenantes bacterium]
MNALEIENVSKRFGDFCAVRNLSFRIPRGTIYGLLGPNGAGKTTTIRMVMNILIPDDGGIKVLDRRMDEAMKAHVGYLPEDRGLYPKMKVGEMMLFLAEIKGMTKVKAKPAIDRWLERLDLGEWRGKKVEALSKGMQQKIQFIVTVLHEQDLIILDEPFAGLDPLNVKLIKDIMLEFKDKGKTIIFSTHRMEQVEMICDNICLLNKARMVLEGSLQEIKKRYGKNTVVLDYEGDGGFVKDLPEVVKVDDYGRSMEIKLRDKADPQSLLRSLVGRVRVHRFEIQEPSLNAIFIDNVGVDHEKDTSGH